MTPIPMFTPPPHPDGWHRVTAPGGYETWHFEAEDAEGRRLVIEFHDGFPSDRDYLRRYAAYRRRPTRTRPPVPGDFPHVSFFCLVPQFAATYPAGSFAASADGMEIAVGPNRVRREADGTVRLSLATSGSWPTLTAEVAFRPTGGRGPELTLFPPRPVAVAGHQWVVAGPRCDVEATIDLGDGGRARFTGRGYHDHTYGTAPLGLTATAHGRGRTIGGGDGDYAFRFIQPHGRGVPVVAHLVRVDATGAREIAVASPGIEWRRGGFSSPRCPARIDLGPHLRLSNPHSWVWGRGAVSVQYDADADGKTVPAACEFEHLDRPL